MAGKKYFYDAILEKLIEKPYSSVVLITTTQKILLSPSYLKDPSKGIWMALQKKCQIYDPALEGFLLGWKKVEIQKRSSNFEVCGRKGEVQIFVDLDCYVFQPKVGCILEGVVNFIAENHLVCLVHSYFNATILRSDYELPETWEQRTNHVVIGDTLLIKVTELDFSGALPDIKADILYSSPLVLTAKKVKTSTLEKEKNELILPDTSIQSMQEDVPDSGYEDHKEKLDTLHDDVQAKKKKKKKNQGSSILSSTQCTQDEDKSAADFDFLSPIIPQKSKKKSKKKDSKEKKDKHKSKSGKLNFPLVQTNLNESEDKHSSINEESETNAKRQIELPHSTLTESELQRSIDNVKKKKAAIHTVNNFKSVPEQNLPPDESPTSEEIFKSPTKRSKESEILINSGSHVNTKLVPNKSSSQVPSPKKSKIYEEPVTLSDKLPSPSTSPKKSQINEEAMKRLDKPSPQPPTCFKKINEKAAYKELKNSVSKTIQSPKTPKKTSSKAPKRDKHSEKHNKQSKTSPERTLCNSKVGKSVADVTNNRKIDEYMIPIKNEVNEGSDVAVSVEQLLSQAKKRILFDDSDLCNLRPTHKKKKTNDV